MNNFSSVAELKRNLPSLSGVTTITDLTLTATIQDGDKIIYDDLSKFVDWNDVGALDYIPRIINRLSQYKACELTLVRLWHNDDAIVGDGTEAKNNAFTYYEEQYEKLLNKIKSGDIFILDKDNNEISAEVARRPGLGRII